MYNPQGFSTILLLASELKWIDYFVVESFIVIYVAWWLFELCREECWKLLVAMWRRRILQRSVGFAECYKEQPLKAWLVYRLVESRMSWIAIIVECYREQHGKDWVCCSFRRIRICSWKTGMLFFQKNQVLFLRFERTMLEKLASLLNFAVLLLNGMGTLVLCSPSSCCSIGLMSQTCFVLSAVFFFTFIFGCVVT